MLSRSSSDGLWIDPVLADGRPVSELWEVMDGPSRVARSLKGQAEAGPRGKPDRELAEQAGRSRAAGADDDQSRNADMEPWNPGRRPEFDPEGLWLLPGCSQMIYRKQMEANLSVCPECGHHYRIGAGPVSTNRSIPARLAACSTTSSRAIR